MWFSKKPKDTRTPVYCRECGRSLISKNEFMYDRYTGEGKVTRYILACPEIFHPSLERRSDGTWYDEDYF